MAALKLGLIGDHIARSQSPLLHVEAGRLCGLDISYDRLIPRDLGLDFETVFDRCATAGFRGINVTYPYKQRVIAGLTVPDPLTTQIGACNTVLFGGGCPEGHNTDYSGFAAAFRATFGNISPGTVAMAGAGGVGKAIAFALATLGARELRVFDTDARRASDLVSTLHSVNAAMTAVCASSVAQAADMADGLVNCTPLGMDGHPGTAIGSEHMGGASWAFDAVYTPVETEFLRLASARGAMAMSGYELFFHQGVDAFRLFTGLKVDAAALRNALKEASFETQQP